MPTPALKVAIPVSLSGAFSLQGRQALAGLRAWAEAANHQGGARVGGQLRPVELLWRDDRSRRDGVRQATERLIVDDGADILMGPYSAVLSLAAAEVSRRHCKLLWNQGGASAEIYRRGNPWVVGLLTPADEYLAGLLPAVRQAAPAASTLAILRAATGAFPADVCRGVERAAAALGFRVVLRREFDAQSPDFAEVVADVRQAAPDILVAVGRLENDLLLARRLMETGACPPFAALVAAGVQRFQDELGAAAEGFIGPSQWEPPPPSPAAESVDATGRDAAYFGPTAAAVMNELRRAGDADPAGPLPVDYPMAQAYAAGVALERCLQAAGTAADAALRKAAAGLEFRTFYGRFRTDPATGRPAGRQMLLVQWQGGRKVAIWPPETAAGRLRLPEPH